MTWHRDCSNHYAAEGGWVRAQQFGAGEVTVWDAGNWTPLSNLQRA